MRNNMSISMSFRGNGGVFLEYEGKADELPLLLILGSAKLLLECVKPGVSMDELIDAYCEALRDACEEIGSKKKEGESDE
ncbi:MAG: hypothetical protein IJ484_07875 [Oscillospiraceae bacterium]|nr:hypothetical protein [Oscillospiraceae bacterium]